MSNLTRKSVETSAGARRGARTAGAIVVVPVRHRGRAVLAGIVLIFAAIIVYAFVRNPNIKWNVVRHFLFNGAVIDGLVVTLELTGLSIAFGLALAVVLALMRLSKSRIISKVAFVYVFLFRSIPLIVVLIFVGNAGLFAKTLSIPIPFTDLDLYSGRTQTILTPFVASCVGLTLAASAYMSEVVRGGLLAVSPGQTHAARALGISPAKTLRYVVLPQALRVILPPLGNEFIGALKASALVSVIAGGDLLTATESIGGVTYRTIELMLVASFWYVVIIATWSVFQYFLERRVAER